MTKHDVLIKELKKARRTYDRGDEIGAYVQTLIAVTNYFQLLRVPEELMLPLHKLRNKTFNDTQRNKRAGHPQRAFELTYLMAAAAGCVTDLKGARMDSL